MSGHKSKLKKMDLFVRTPDRSNNWKRRILFVLYVTYVQMYLADKIGILIMTGHESKSQKMDLIYLRA